MDGKLSEDDTAPRPLDRLMQVTDARAWISLAALGLTVATGMGWMFFGRLAAVAEGDGALVRRSETVKASAAGVVARLLAFPGQEVGKGDTLLALGPPGRTGDGVAAKPGEGAAA